ncbi:hypothetical protein BDZ45DRAFT_249813 [Acephala macrosclerotiorum]|nr:hypothetical protein BDZ45DRAFT_249813 [Acephala macrosclerotiorum]
MLIGWMLEMVLESEWFFGTDISALYFHNLVLVLLLSSLSASILSSVDNQWLSWKHSERTIASSNAFDGKLY